MFSNKTMVALVGAAMILTTASFAKGVTGNSKPQQQKGKPVVTLAQGLQRETAAAQRQAGGGLGRTGGGETLGSNG